MTKRSRAAQLPFQRLSLPTFRIKSVELTRPQTLIDGSTEILVIAPGHGILEISTLAKLCLIPES
jgi:hypothetical protein